jgi:hypothetical protein
MSITDEKTPETKSALRNVYAYLLRRHYARLASASQRPCQPSPTPQTTESQTPEIKAEIVDEASV